MLRFDYIRQICNTEVNDGTAPELSDKPCPDEVNVNFQYMINYLKPLCGKSVQKQVVRRPIFKAEILSSPRCSSWSAVFWPFFCFLSQLLLRQHRFTRKSVSNSDTKQFGMHFLLCCFHVCANYNQTFPRERQWMFFNIISSLLVYVRSTVFAIPITKHKCYHGRCRRLVNSGGHR